MRRKISYFETSGLLLAHTTMLDVGFANLIGPLNDIASLVER